MRKLQRVKWWEVWCKSLKNKKFIGSYLGSHMTYDPQNLYVFLWPHTLHVYQILWNDSELSSLYNQVYKTIQTCTKVVTKKYNHNVFPNTTHTPCMTSLYQVYKRHWVSMIIDRLPKEDLKDLLYTKDKYW